MYEELAGPAKLHLLQSVVSTILVEMIFGAYFVGLSKERANQFKQMEEYLASLSQFSRWQGLDDDSQIPQAETNRPTNGVPSP
jgi:hypothetical protein